MEEVLQRFAHIGQQIFEQLDIQDLMECKKVGRNWKEFISQEKLVPFRIIKDDSNMSDALIWKFLHRISIQTALNLASTIHTTYKIYYPKEKGNITPKIINGALFLASNNGSIFFPNYRDKYIVDSSHFQDCLSFW